MSMRQTTDCIAIRGESGDYIAAQLPVSADHSYDLHGYSTFDMP